MAFCRKVLKRRDSVSHCDYQNGMLRQKEACLRQKHVLGAVLHPDELGLKRLDLLVALLAQPHEVRAPLLYSGRLRLLLAHGALEVADLDLAVLRKKRKSHIDHLRSLRLTAFQGSEGNFLETEAALYF